MAESADRRTRLLRSRAGSLLVLVLVSACSSGKVTGAVSTQAPAASAVQMSIPTASGSTPASTTSAPGADGAAILQHAFDLIAGGYHFVTTATVNSAVVVQAEGDRVNDGTKLSVASKGATIDYVVTPNGTWVNQNGTWSELSDPAPVSDPIGSLRAPTSVVVSASANGAPTEVIASYPPAALSLPGDAPIDVVFSLEGATLRSLQYATTANGAPALVHSDVTALVDTSPVTLPSP